MSFETWEKSGHEFSGWTSGDCRVGKKVYIWATLASASTFKYASGDVEFCVVSPNGQRGKWAKMQSAKPKEPGDPNYGGTTIVSEKGIYPVIFRFTAGGSESGELEGVGFEVE